MADPDLLDEAISLIAVLTFAVGLVIAIGLLLDPNDYPRDRPPPKLAVYATCPVEAP